MAINHAAVIDTPECVALEMSQHLETLAAAGAWSELEDLVVRLRSAVIRVPAADRRAVLVAIRRTTENVALAAANAREEVAGRLSTIRRGQVAAKAYDGSKSSYL